MEGECEKGEDYFVMRGRSNGEMECGHGAVSDVKVYFNGVWSIVSIAHKLVVLKIQCV